MSRATEQAQARAELLATGSTLILRITAAGVDWAKDENLADGAHEMLTSMLIYLNAELDADNAHRAAIEAIEAKAPRVYRTSARVVCLLPAAPGFRVATLENGHNPSHAFVRYLPVMAWASVHCVATDGNRYACLEAMYLDNGIPRVSETQYSADAVVAPGEEVEIHASSGAGGGCYLEIVWPKKYVGPWVEGSR